MQLFSKVIVLTTALHGVTWKVDATWRGGEVTVLVGGESDASVTVSPNGGVARYVVVLKAGQEQDACQLILVGADGVEAPQGTLYIQHDSAGQFIAPAKGRPSLVLDVSRMAAE